MKLYETGLIFDPTLEEAGFDEQIKKVTDIIESNSGKIENVDRWGIRKLAYLIKKKSQGYYTFLYYNAPPEVPQLIEKMLRINEHCLRFMTIVPEALPEALEEKAEAPARESARIPETPPVAPPVEAATPTETHSEETAVPETESAEQPETDGSAENSEEPKEDL